MKDIYLLMENQQRGPFTEGQVRQSLSEGIIPADLSAWHDGLPDWVPIASIVPPKVAPSPAVPPPYIPPLVSHPPALVPNVTDASGGTGECTYPWYRSSILVGLIIGIPWLLGSFLAVLLKPFLIAGLVLMATGPIYYNQKTQTKVLPHWFRWLGRGLLVLAIPFYLSVLYHSFVSPPPEVAILAVLRQDQKLSSEYGRLRNNIDVTGDEGLDRVADVTNQVIVEMKRISLNKCPPDFQEAYNRHINCWLAWADVVGHHPHIQNGGEALLEGFIRGLAGDPTGGAFEKQAEIDSFLSRGREGDLEIKQSFEDVEAIALKYGVHREDYSN